MPPSTQQVVGGLAAVARLLDVVDHVLPQRNRADVQVVVAQRGGAHDAGVGAQVRVLVGEVGEGGSFESMSSRARKRGRGAFVIPERCGQTGLEELRAARVAADHVPGVGDRSWCDCATISGVAVPSRIDE